MQERFQQTVCCLLDKVRLEWSNIDFTNSTLTVTATKNKLAHTLPIPEFIYNLLQRRYNNIVLKSKFVFPGSSISGHLSDPRKQVDKVIAVAGINFTLHDLRRTFITTAESLELSAYALKKLLNHKSGNDVTAGYIVLDLERLRQPMQAITAKLLKLIGLPASNMETTVASINSISA